MSKLIQPNENQNDTASSTIFFQSIPRLAVFVIVLGLMLVGWLLDSEHKQIANFLGQVGFISLLVTSQIAFLQSYDDNWKSVRRFLLINLSAVCIIATGLLLLRLVLLLF